MAGVKYYCQKLNAGKGGRGGGREGGRKGGREEKREMIVFQKEYLFGLFLMFSCFLPSFLL